MHIILESLKTYLISIYPIKCHVINHSSCFHVVATHWSAAVIITAAVSHCLATDCFLIVAIHFFATDCFVIVASQCSATGYFFIVATHCLATGCFLNVATHCSTDVITAAFLLLLQLTVRLQWWSLKLFSHCCNSLFGCSDNYSSNNGYYRPRAIMISIGLVG